MTGPVACRPLARVICAAVLSALLLTACGGGGGDESTGPTTGESEATGRAPDARNCPLDALEQADGPVEVTLWHPLSGLAAETLEQLAEEYNATQDAVRVSVESQGDYEELFAKYTSASRSSDLTGLPEILLAQSTDTQYLVDSGTVVAASDCIAADPDAAAHYDTLADLVRSAYTVDGLLWPAAFGVATPVLYLNRAHLEQAGLDPDSPPRTLTELRATAEAIKAVRPEGTPLAFRAHSWWMENLATLEGDALVDRDNGRSGLARRSELLNDSVTEVAAWMSDMVDDGLMKVFYATQVTEAPLSVMRPDADSSSMVIETSSAVTTLDALLGGGDVDVEVAEAAGAVDIDVGQLPGLSRSGSGEVAGNAWYVVDGQGPEKVAAAWDFLRWVTRTPQQVRWAQEGSYLPVWQGAVEDPGLQRYFTETRPGRWLEVARQSLGSIDPAFPGPLIGPYAELRQALRVALERAFIEGQPVDQELQQADSTFQSALDDYARDVGRG